MKKLSVVLCLVSFVAMADSWSNFQAKCESPVLTGDQKATVKAVVDCKQTSYDARQTGTYQVTVPVAVSSSVEIAVDSSKGNTDLGYDEYQGPSSNGVTDVAISCPIIEKIETVKTVNGLVVTCADAASVNFNLNGICAHAIAEAGGKGTVVGSVGTIPVTCGLGAGSTTSSK